MSRPSPLALWLIERSVAPHERDTIVGDLVEEFEIRAATDTAGANRWLWDQTLRSILPNIRRRLSPESTVAAESPARGARMLNGLATDLRFAVRLMRRQPFMTAVALISLSAGLGLNVLLLTLSDAVLLRPLPLREPSRLVLLLLQRETGIMHNFSYPEYQDLRDQTSTVESLVAYSPAEATLTLSDYALPLQGELVSGNLFGGLGVPIRTGRALTDQDDRAASPPAAVISYQLWRDRFGSAPLIGQTISLNREQYTVVGVAAPSFAGLQIGRGASFWVPLAHSRALAGGDYLSRPTVSWLTVMGRLRPGTATAAAREELDTILRRVRAVSKRPIEPVVLEPGARGDSILSGELESPLRLLLAAGALVLLVACLNVTNLQLARAEARRLELAVRTALGARRSQLVRLMLLDGFLIASVAGVAGVALAIAVKDRAASLIALYGQPVSLAIPVDRRVVIAAVLLALLAALVIGLLSTWQIVRRRPGADLGDARAATAARRSAQRALVVAQVALSMGLLTGASLLVRTLDRLRGTDLGFESRHVAVFQVSPEMGQLPSPAASAYFDDAVRAVAALPGVQGAAVAHVMPLDFGGSRTSVEVAGYKPAQDEDMELNFVRVSGGYFTTLGLPILQGRTFDESDARQGQPQRIIVNETMARRYWPDGRAVGRLIRYDDRNPYDTEVIGVVPDVHYRMVREEPRPSFYVLLAQWPAREGVIHVRVSGEPASRIDEIRRVLAALNPAVPVTRAYTLRDQVERNIADERMAMAIGLTLAVVALVLATAGLYATMAFVVGRRTREIGVRMALGARTTDVRSLVLREGVVLALAGVVGGLALSAWAGYALRNQLYGVSQMDVVSFVVAAVILAAAALMASWIPARRASRVDPVVALRDS